MSSPPDEPDEMSDEALAAALGLDPATLAAWQTTGRLQLYIYSEELATLLRINDQTPSKWMSAGRLAGRSAGYKRTQHRVTDVDALLAEDQRNFVTPLTIAELRAGRVRLLTVQEASTYLHVTPAVLRHQLGTSDVLQSVRLVRYFRVSEASVEALIAARQTFATTHIDRQIVALITGYEESTILNLVHQGRLRTAVGPGNTQPIEINSLIELLSMPGMLCPGVTPQEWIAKRTAEQEQPVLLQKAAEGLGVNLVILHRMLADNELEWIKSPGKGRGAKTFVPPSSIRAHLAAMPALTDEQLALSFDTNVESIRRLRLEGRLVCPLAVHRHSGDELKSPCVTALWKRGVRG
jgi:hypothetical protein